MATSSLRGGGRLLLLLLLLGVRDEGEHGGALVRGLVHGGDREARVVPEVPGRGEDEVEDGGARFVRCRGEGRPGEGARRLRAY